MFDISFAELLIVAVIALVVLGPEELPRALRAVVKFFRSLKSMWLEVQQGIDTLMDDEDVKEVRRQVDAERRYIIDEAGNYQEVHDISEWLDTKPKPAPKQDTPSE